MGPRLNTEKPTSRVFIDRIHAMLVILTALMFAGCLSFSTSDTPRGGSEAAWTAISNGAPVRVAVFVDAGARGVGMFRYLTMMDRAAGIVATPVDGAAIRDGALERTDLLVMPGGLSNLEESRLGEAGCRAVRDFIERGGSYLGSCAGAYLLMQSRKRPNKILGLAPYYDLHNKWGGEATVLSVWNEHARTFADIKPGRHSTRFNGGPVFVPSNCGLPEAKFTALATFGGNLHTYSSPKERHSMSEGASCVAGRFGRGRVWLFADHPEYYPKDWYLVEGALRYLTGRSVTFTAPQRRRGALAVGWFCAPSPGVASARIALDLKNNPAFDVVPYSTAEVERTDLRHLDVLVIPDAVDDMKLAKVLGEKENRAPFERFLARDGRILAWGEPLKYLKPHRNLFTLPQSPVAADCERRLTEIARLAPEKRPAIPAKRATSTKTAIYADAGADGGAFARWIRLLALSPDCRLDILDANDVKTGALQKNGYSLYIAPGGVSDTQVARLGALGCTNLVRFIRAGGSYLGTCAGCYMTLENDGTKRGCIGNLAPYIRQKSPYRGNGHLAIAFTERAKLLGLKPGETREVRYYGGPVMLPGRAVPGAEIGTVAKFACDGIYSFSTNQTPVMAGHAAIIAGTLDRGRLVGIAPHPESYFHTRDIICGGLKYLTGHGFEEVCPQRRRGDLSVGLYADHLGKTGAQLAQTLFSTAGLDVMPVDDEVIPKGALEHCDVLVITNPRQGDWTRYVETFARQGGRIIVLKTRARAVSVPKGLANVTVCPTLADVLKEIRR